MFPQILEKIVAIPRVYDGVQKMAGREENYRRLLPFLLRAKGETLLDTGGGTGEITRILDPTTRYTWLDIDPQKLSGFRQKCPRGLAVLGSVTEIPLAQSSMHATLCVAVSHHLTDRELYKMFAELARVCRKQIIFLDAVENRNSPGQQLHVAIRSRQLSPDGGAPDGDASATLRDGRDAAVFDLPSLSAVRRPADRSGLKSVLSLRNLAANLEQDHRGLWVSKNRSDVSYPSSDNELCYQIEDTSFWFQHRNRCIANCVRAYPPSGVVFDVGGGNGFVSLDYSVKAGIRWWSSPASRVLRTLNGEASACDLFDV